jgi:hypothetical protein
MTRCMIGMSEVEVESKPAPLRAKGAAPAERRRGTQEDRLKPMLRGKANPSAFL